MLKVKAPFRKDRGLFHAGVIPLFLLFCFFCCCKNSTLPPLLAMGESFMLRRLTLAAALLAGSALTAQANNFRWANDGDVNSMDPYTRQETFLLAFGSNFYEPLVRRDREGKVEAALAERWEQPQPKVWRFHLRRGVKFPDGTPFPARPLRYPLSRFRAPASPSHTLPLSPTTSP